MTTSTAPVAHAPYPVAPRHAPHHQVTVVLTVLVGVVLLAGLTLVGVGSLVFGQAPARVDRAQLETALGTAAVAQQDVAQERGRYTTRGDELAAMGWAPENDVDLHLVSADEVTYCMAAGPVGGDPALWWTPAGASDEPCR